VIGTDVERRTDHVEASACAIPFVPLVLLEGALTAALAAVKLARIPLQSTEVASAVISGRSVSDILHIITHDEANMGGYYLVLHAWRMFGTSITALRTLSVLGAVVAVVATANLGRVLFGRRTGALAGFVVAVSPFAVFYARDARAYSWLIALSALTTLAFVHLVRSPGRWAGPIYALATMVALWFHVIALVVALAHVVSLAWLPPSRQRTRNVLVWLVVGGIGFTPLVPVFLKRRNSQIDWVKPLNLHQIAAVPKAFGGDALLAVVLGVLLVVAVVATWRRVVDRTPGNWPIALAWAGLVVPPITLGLVSAVKPLFVDRYLAICLPFLALLLALGILRIRAPLLRAGVLAVVALIATWVVVHPDVKPSPIEDAVRRVASKASSKDAIDFARESDRVLMTYYLDRTPPNRRPHDIGITSSSHRYFYEPRASNAIVVSRLGGVDRLWLVTPKHGQLNRLFGSSMARTLESKFDQGARQEFGAIWVTEYARLEGG
jgi:dolichyl-phosphate-mannose-protein mannosyltransferase